MGRCINSGYWGCLTWRNMCSYSDYSPFEHAVSFLWISGERASKRQEARNAGWLWPPRELHRWWGWAIDPGGTTVHTEQPDGEAQDVWSCEDAWRGRLSREVGGVAKGWTVPTRLKPHPPSQHWLDRYRLHLASPARWAVRPKMTLVNGPRCQMPTSNSVIDPVSWLVYHQDPHRLHAYLPWIKSRSELCWLRPSLKATWTVKSVHMIDPFPLAFYVVLDWLYIYRASILFSSVDSLPFVNYARGG